MRKKVILAIADGVGDLPCDELGKKTPLEYANTPNLDRYAKLGTTGIVDIIGPGIPIGTDLSHMILFGYEPEDYPGRGPIEASGAGIKLIDGDVAFRCNFATVDKNMNVLDRRAGRIRENTPELAHEINELKINGVTVLFREATEHRAVLVLRGKGLSDKVSDSDPKVIQGKTPYKKVKPLDDSAESKKTAEILNLLFPKVHKLLENHQVNKQRKEDGKLPANFILLRGAGQLSNLVPISEQLNFRGACIAAEGTVLGVGRIAGFDTYTHESLTGNLDTNIEKKAELVLEALQTHDFVAVNVKAPDLMGHDNDPKRKVQAIEMFDKLFDYIKPEELENTVLAVLADHSTPCERREHSGDPVPLLLFGQSIRVDRTDRYTETDCSYGGLSRMKGKELIDTLFDFMECKKKQGN